MTRPRHPLSTAPTARGIAMLAVGLAMVVSGIGFAAPALVRVGVMVLMACLVGYLWVRGSVSAFRRSFPHARRDVLPYPLSVGSPGTVTVSLTALRHGPGGVSRGMVAALDVREQAAGELTGGSATRAVVSRSRDALTLTYSLAPRRRGRWPLGPALVHSGDPLGLWWNDTAVGEVQTVPVWPAIIDLAHTTGTLLGEADRVALGARMPSADDAALRDYRRGDDLRRVHWASSARRGDLLVRSDERAGRRPVTVMLDVSPYAVPLEWGISAAASLAVSVLASGHPTRLLAGDLGSRTTEHVGDQALEAGRAALLDQTLDLAAPASRAQATEHLVRIARQVAHDAAHGEVVIAVLEELDEQAVDALVPLGSMGRAWALMRTSGSHAAPDAQSGLRALRRSGWRVATVSLTDDLTEVWTELSKAARP